MSWQLKMTDDVKEWLHRLRKDDRRTSRLVGRAVAALLEDGPALGRPLVDRVKGSHWHNLKELRPPSAGRSEVRILFVFDPIRNAVLLVAGDKAGSWNAWYATAIPQAEALYLEWLDQLDTGGDDER
ncbi:hypothetical protein Afil01_12730 [Actinorhabdospora filicis]|uniref:Addiction module toxin RelE n=1 Tax=Actinorhabdospora filicis TaxID=1785913 RepID=A0A9W6SKV6_9ACTN|nr:type II toxin-antitoxin system RelE/ParE family toxin [Actinorhabdospora filicis]GLZ76466.1 hypothetical protein Afil01_12730 [Actinorhabdospora filicis]